MRRRLALAGVILSSCVLPRVDFDASLEAAGGGAQMGGAGGSQNTAMGGTNAAAGTTPIGGTNAAAGTNAAGGTNAAAGTNAAGTNAAGGASAGAGGGNSARICKSEVGDPSAVLVDNFENGSLAQPQVGGRFGGWTTFSDMSAGCTVTLQSIALATPGHSSTFAASFSGTGCTTWGAATSLDFNASNNGTFCAYDVSVYDGVTFYAKSDESTATRVSMMQLDIQETQFGGTCNLGTAKCSDFFAAVIALTPTWSPFTIKFKDLKQGGFGAKFAFDPSKVFGIELQTSSPSATTTTKFHIEFDDLSFTLASSGGSGGASSGGAGGASARGGSN